MATLVFAVLDQAPLLQGRLSRGQPPGRDFAVFWTASRLALSGRSADVFDPTHFHESLAEHFGESAAFMPFPYPPLGLLVTLPLGLLPYLVSFLLWTGLALVFYLAVAGSGPTVRLQRAALLLAPATILTMTFGQNGLLTGGLFLAGLGLLERRPGWAGVCFALLTFKPQLGLLIPVALIAGRYWRTFATATAGTIVLLGVSLGFGGLASWRQYLDVVLPMQAGFMEEGSGFATFMVPSAFMAVRIVGGSSALGYLIQSTTAIFALVGVVWAFRSSADMRLRASALIAGTFLTSPYVFSYDLALLSVTVVWLFERGMADGFLRGETMVLALCWLLPLGVMLFNAVGLPLGPIILLAIFCVVLLRIQDGNPQLQRSRG